MAKRRSMQDELLYLRSEVEFWLKRVDNLDKSDMKVILSKIWNIVDRIIKKDY